MIKEMTKERLEEIATRLKDVLVEEYGWERDDFIDHPDLELEEDEADFLGLHYKITATCSYCGEETEYEMSKEEHEMLKKYWCYGRQLGYLQDLFPKVPAWIRSGAIDQYSGGFCICPKCSGEEE